MKLKQQLTLVGATVFAVAVSAVPLQAAIERHAPLDSPELTKPLISLSWSEIWDKLRRKEVPGGSRGNRNQPTICAVVPGSLIDRETDEMSWLYVWGLNPVFVWQEEWSHLQVFRSQDHKILLSQELSPGTHHLAYGDVAGAIPLEPGSSYYWRLSRGGTADQPVTFGETSFRTFDIERHLTLAAELAAIDPTEDALSARVKFFADRDLWADVARELYTADELTTDLQALKDEIAGHDFCASSPGMSLE